MERDRIFDQFPKLVLPKGQSVIETPPFKNANTYVQEVRRKKVSGVPRIGLITGEPGTGKTSLALDIVMNSKPLSHTLLRKVLYFEIRNGMSPKYLLDKFMLFFGENPGNVSHPKLIEPVKNLLELNSISLILLDEGNRISNDLFETIRELFDYTSVSIVILAHPSILPRIKAQPALDSRIWQPFTLQALNEDEIVTEYLPNLTVPHWRFDKNKSEDRSLGINLWARVKPDLRKLQSLLDEASKTAEEEGVEWINKELLDRVKRLNRWSLHSLKEDIKEEALIESQASKMDFEKQSEDRHLSKEREQQKKEERKKKKGEEE